MSKHTHKQIVIVAGPTAVGKTRVAIDLAKALNTEIVSCDSRQLYKEMSIGTAKPSPQELAEVLHHFIGSHSIHNAYTAADYHRDARAVIDTVLAKNDTVVVAGGTGLFIKAILEGFDSIPDTDPNIESDLIKIFESHGIEALQRELLSSDPSYYWNIDIQNHRRVIRALAVIRTTGLPFSSFLKKEKAPYYDAVYFVLNRKREHLYDRINARVDIMMERGLLNEVKALEAYKSLRSLRTVGYQELFEYLAGQCTYEHALSKIKQHSRNYAKRQITWFKKVENAIWIDLDSEKEVVPYMLNHIKL